MKSVGGSTRRGWTWTALVVGFGFAAPAWASSWRVPAELPLAPGGPIPLLSTPDTLAPAASPVRASENPRAPRAVAWQVPLAFEPANEHAPADADYTARGPGYSVFVGSGGALLALQQAESRPAPAASDLRPGSEVHRQNPRLAGSSDNRPLGRQLVRMRFGGARADAPSRAEHEQPGLVHRLLGSDPTRWRSGLRTHGRVVYDDVYPGIDVAYYGRGRELEFDFIVAPGADASAARLSFDGVRALHVDDRGDLVLDTGAGSLVQRRPVAFQRGPKGRETVPAAYVLEADGSVTFRLGDYDRERELVIDPVLSYATFVGGTGLDQCWDVAVDADGAAYVTGETESFSLAALRIVSTNAFQTNYQGGVFGIGGDAFVAKLRPDGQAFEWFTYLGGSDIDSAFTLGLASGNQPVVAGFTASTNFPVTASAWRSRVTGETNRYNGRYSLEGFITRLRSDGSGLVASTLYGGDGEDQVLDLTLTSSEAVVVVGSTSSSNLTVRPAGNSSFAGAKDGFFAVLSPNLDDVSAAAYFGGSGLDTLEGVALNPAQTVAHTTGITQSTNLPVVAPVQADLGGAYDALVAGFRLADGAVDYASYLGGAQDDYGYRLAVGPSGQVWITGVTFSTNFPTVAPLITSTNLGASDAILSRLAADGRTLEMSTLFGGTSSDAFWDVAVDSAGQVHLAGETLSAMLPGVSTNSLYGTNQGLSDIVIVRIGNDGTPSTSFFGAPGDELAYAITTDTAGNAYIAGRVRSINFPVSSTNVAQAAYGGDRTDGFAMKVAYEPALVAEATAENIVLSWPAPNAGFVLESAPMTAGSSGPWSRPSTPMTTAEGRHSVRLPMSATNSVFRLRWDPQ